MRIAIPKEILPGENRVAVVPETVAKMVKAGMEVWVESGAGESAHISDGEYQKAGARIEPKVESLLGEADVVLKVQRPVFDEKRNRHEGDLIREKATLIGLLLPLTYPDVAVKLNARKVTAFALDCLPRIARAQSMDALSSMSNIAGYKSVIMAANALGRMFPMMTTAAGTIPPAKVVVIGAGVAGLQAIATARRLGGVVTAFDTRPVVAEQVKSLGGEFVSLEVSHEQAQDTGGYAKELPAEFYKKEQEILRKYIQEADVVITSALIPGKRAPLLITEEMLRAMKPGSVIVDLAVEQKGNCVFSEPGKIVVRHGITLIGTLNIPSTVAVHASQLYAKNVLNFLNHIAPDGKSIRSDLNDEIIRGSLITHNGEILHPGVKGLIGLKSVA
ncbi:MAG: Re/Si-specific NAD(P)(+) transhydrogenase subunit alpha [Elusimicrobia bacterium]|nr:Re/Si-specific NAD(P)(+) transhydrogenase subunit alpha [Elusimicrobiota bacterium]